MDSETIETLLMSDSTGVPRIGIVAPLVKEQRLIDALWVFETLQHIPFDYQAFIIGDGKERDNLLRCRDGWKLSACVHFLGNCQDVLRLMKQFDMLLHLGSEQADCFAVRAALFMQIPVIATDTPQTRRLIADTEKCILLPDCGTDSSLRRRLFAKRTLRFFRPVIPLANG
jgi:glycosyltransferase involved in cell wall biosynthesis